MTPWSAPRALRCPNGRDRRGRGDRCLAPIADESIRSSGLDWTLVCTTRPTHGPTGGTYRADDRLPMKDDPTISRAGVAAFMHKAAHGREWIHRSAKAFPVSSPAL